ncbi:membrane protein [Bacillus glycinifermentans]|uniref:DUF2262 domain-containing protein n=1 Tax=Bacillus glycinifermentans TaxID=1664069 RepID=A0A0J6EF03_9BACI|nr:DUF2262 domain-containing protein [Bacillus glycinifermentans]ATH91875.1 DUF2262 domain-containing protein [Bacillus glycinifermentans]KMM62921.1 membrane protein [Bacillus glycinifermentans]KRT92897.1 hypothetical protein AB447_221710 [Bacillus glycinifermentans]MEC0486267.1 DUF2262 domain-containing protein [Bacillus glycinifermentans]MEC0494981.1 DUF2262 domain-containing protein [Bacillus glycinifermentans]
MGRSRQIKQFEKRFRKEVIEVAAVTGPSGIGAGRADDDAMWRASIPLIAWKEPGNGKPAVQEELDLEWLADDDEWEKTGDLLEANAVVRLYARMGDQAMMLVKVADTDHQDEELQSILQKSLKPVYYEDEKLGTFELFKSVNVFEKDITWAGQNGKLYFDWDEDDRQMQASLETAHILFQDQAHWNAKIRAYAAEELVELANEWLQDNDEAEFEEITKKMFIELMELSSISVYPDGDFEVFFDDGDMFWGHSIIVSGHRNGTFESAEIAG